MSQIQTQQQTVVTMTIEEFNSNTTSLLQNTIQMLRNNEESINNLILYIDSCIEKEQQKISILDKNIEQFESLMNSLTTNFQNLFNN